MTEDKQNAPSFEQAYVRLEQILEKMNSGKATLEEAIKLYEEADQLIVSCNTRLNEAERKIETLIKTREGELLLSQEKQPLTESFS
jgi:exodeoxyribonuclease VII small subunit